jgi:hypothetical protein
MDTRRSAAASTPGIEAVSEVGSKDACEMATSSVHAASAFCASTAEGRDGIGSAIFTSS